jgi:4-amino-4-deoxy-L-arabinose transferase-like glycosyltransferase
MNPSVLSVNSVDRSLVALVVLALALRLVWVAYTDTEVPPLSDPQYYHATAANIAAGRGYTVALDDRGFVAGPEGQPTAFWAPGYPFVLAPLYAVFGPDERAAKALNALAGALTIIPIFALARRVAGRTAGLIAAALFAVAPPLIFWTPVLFSEPLFTLGAATTLAIALWASERRSTLAYFLGGLSLIATAFVRSQGLLLIVPTAVILWPRPADARALARVALPAAAGIAVLVVPWAVRNQRVMGEPYLINDNLGYNLRLAHAPYATGTSIAPRDLWDERPGISFYDRELFWDDVGASRAWEYARTHPGRELQLAPKRIGWLLRSDSAPAMRWSESLGRTPVGGPRDALVLLGDVWWYGLLALAASSLALVRRDRLWLALWSTIAAWLALHLVFAGEPRYHVPLVPVLSVLAAAAIIGLRDRVTKPTGS